MEQNKFNLRASTMMLVCLLMLLSITLFSICIANLALLYKLIVLLLLFIYCYYLFQRYYLLSAVNSVRVLENKAEGLWLLQFSSGDVVTAKLMPDSTVTYLVSVLCFSCLKSHKKFYVTLFSDSLLQQDYKKLLFTLKWTRAC